MNPALQYQILNPATGQFSQIDGGADSNSALLMNILLQLIELNTYERAALLGQTTTDSSAQIQSDALLNTSLFKIG